MDNWLKRIVEDFKARIRQLYGERLVDIVLYGSYARDEQTGDSDIDLAVILTGDVSPGIEIDRMLDDITDISEKYNVLISVYPVSLADYKNLNSPLLMNMRKEGIVA